MSYQIHSYDQINDISDRDQFNDYPADNEQYFLFNGQGLTPQGDEIDLNVNINNSFNFNNNNIFEHSNNMDNFMDNGNSAAPVRRENDNSISNNNFIPNNIDNEKDLNESNILFHDELKNFIDKSDNEEKSLNNHFLNNDFSCFNPNFLDNDKDVPNALNDHDNDINYVDNENEGEKENIEIERITPFPGMNENSESIININEAPINNNILDLSDTQNTNAASLSNSANSQNNQNSLVISSQYQLVSPNIQKSSSTFDPDKAENENESLTKGNDNKKEKKDYKTKKKKEKKEKKDKKEKKGFLRKFKPDSLRKKIKARLHKKLRDIINKKLIESGSIMIFELFPQPFITNVNVMHNKAYLKLTMRTLLKMVFGNKPKDREKVKTNLKVLEYLDSHYEIRHCSGVDQFLNSKYEDVITEYINGKYFDEDVNKLHEEGESKEYINKYIFIGKHWNEFYNNNGKIYR